MQDCQIVELYWSRSEDAIAVTEQKYGRMLFGISVRLVKTAEDAEECVSDTYLTAWNSMPDARPVYLGAFLSKIVRAHSIDKFRRETREKRGGCEVMEELGEFVMSSFDMQKEVDSHRIAELINSFLYSLSEEKRYIFVRRYFYSDSIEDISSSLGIGEGKVKSVLFRLRKSLGALLEREGVSF